MPVGEADRIGQPPRFGRELDDVLLALGVDHEVAQATDRHEGRIASDLAGPLQEFPGGEPPIDEGLHERCRSRPR